MKYTTCLMALRLDFGIPEVDKHLSVGILLTCQPSKFLNYMEKKILFSLVVKIFDDATLLKHQYEF